MNETNSGWGETTRGSTTPEFIQGLAVPSEGEIVAGVWTAIGLLTEALEAILIAPFKSAFKEKPH